MVLAGAGFLFPWSSYITAIDYFFFLYRRDFPQVSVAIPMTYLVSTWIFTGVNVSLVTAVPLHARIGLGYVLFLLSLIAIPFIDLMVHSCVLSIHVAYYLTIFSIAVVGVGSGVQQSSYYGLAGMLPPRYPQAVMVGESVATSIVSITRVITKSSTTSERFGAIAFFVVSVFFILVCVGCQQIIRSSSFVKSHTLQCRQSSEHDKGGGEMEQVSGGEEEAGDQLKLLPVDTKQSSVKAKIKAGLLLRWGVVVEIWQLLVAVFVAFFLTLLLFPGLVSLVQYCPTGDWTPILLVAVFNVPELIAKVVMSASPCASLYVRVTYCSG
jgi:solute carrier family 29 (equilibrative nucleoside transporter) protein 4